MTAHPPRKRACPTCRRRVRITRSNRYKPHTAAPYGTRQCTNTGTNVNANTNGAST